MKKSKKTKPKKVLKPPICHECCVTLGAIPSVYPVTASVDKCTQCGKEEYMASVNDYHWPNNEFVYIWD